MRSDAERYKSLLLCLETNKVKAWWCFNHISQIIAFHNISTGFRHKNYCIQGLRLTTSYICSKRSVQFINILNEIGICYGVIPKKFIFKVLGSLPPSITHLSQTTNVVSATLPCDKFNEIRKKFVLGKKIWSPISLWK